MIGLKCWFPLSTGKSKGRVMANEPQGHLWLSLGQMTVIDQVQTQTTIDL